jgi:glycosyltransferase involved in cell wall biosynthesis
VKAESYRAGRAGGAQPVSASVGTAGAVREVVDGTRASADLREEIAVAGAGFTASAATIRLLFLIGGLGPGGAERQAVHLLEHLPSRGIAACLACFNGYEEDLRRVARAGVPIEFLSLRGGRLWPAAMLGALGGIVRRRRIGLVQAFLPTFDILAPCLRLRRPSLRVVTSRRNIDEQLSVRDVKLLRATGRWAQAVVGNSRAVVESVLRHEGLAEARVHCIPNGLALPPPVTAGEREAARAAFHLPAEAFVVSYPAHFRRGKGHDHLPRAFRAWMAAVPSSMLVLAGDTEVNAAYRATACRLREALSASGLGQRVRWAGVVSEMRGLLAASDATLNLSDFEGMSNAIMESMAHGVPVVATRTGGAAELMREGVEGYLVAPGDAEGAARRLVELAGDPELRARMGERARVRMGEEFSVARMVDRYADLYRRLAGETR